VAHILGGVAWALACALVARRAAPLPHKTAYLLLATLLLLTTAFFAHYLVPIVGLAAIAGDRRLERIALALCLGSLASYAVEMLAPAMPGEAWIGSAGYQVLGSALLLGPLVLTLLGMLRDRSRGSWSLPPRG
jgi:hypothetical protein